MSAKETIKRKSNHMLRFQLEVEKLMRRKLTQFEAASQLYLSCALVHAAEMVKKDKQTKGEQNV